MVGFVPSDDWPRADLLRCCSVFMSRLTLACSFLVNGMRFDPLKLFIMCRRDAVLRVGLMRNWQLILDGRNHARNPAGSKNNPKLQRIHIRMFNLSLVPFGAVQCDQTSACATHRIMYREEVGQSLQGQVRFVLRVRLQHGNNRDCSAGTFSARRRGLGIFAVAALARLTNKHIQVLFHTICGTPGGRSASDSIR